MDLPNIVLAWDSEVSRLHNCAVDMLAPILTHLLLVDNTEEFRDELWIDCQQLYQAIPNAKDLVSHDLDITGN